MIGIICFCMGDKLKCILVVKNLKEKIFLGGMNDY